MFSETQTFVVSSSVVGGAAEVGLSKIRLYFRAKPNASGNKSGILEPGVTLYVLPVTNGVPDVTDVLKLPFTRVEYTSIQVSSDATAFTDFTFPTPVKVKTDQEWAFSVVYDGNEDFILWKSRQGDTLVASDQRSPGPSGQYVGKYFTYITSLPASSATTVSSSFGTTGSSTANSSTTVQEFLASNWKSRTDVDVKFTVFCARYRNAGSANLTPLVPNNTPAAAVIRPGSIFAVSNTDGSFGYKVPARRYEHITYDRATSAAATIKPGHTAWQHGPFYPDNKSPATISVTANSTTVTTTTANFNDLFGGSADPAYVVAFSENHDGSGLHTAAARRVLSVSSNTSLVLSSPMPFTNAVAKFYKAPVGLVDSVGARQLSRQTYVMSLVDSSANSTVRFANSTVESITVSAGGTGYNNNDVITVSGFQNVAGKVVGGYSARAVLSTNSTGGITTVYMANAGCGFSNSSSITVSVANSTGGATTGSGANLVPVVGMTVITEQAYRGIDGYVKGGIVTNLDVTTTVIPSMIDAPMGTFVRSSVRLPYSKVPNASLVGGWEYHCDDADASNDVVPVTSGTVQTHRLSKRRIIPSWSNEQVITYEVSGVAVGGRGAQSNGTLVEYPGMSNAISLEVSAASNNDFVTVTVPPFITGLGSYSINNDANNEHTNYGSALARGITKKFNFANNTFAEDVRFYMNAYRPAGTDVLVYARVYNSADPDSFDDKDWTRLEIKEGASSYSSSTDTQDYVRLTMGFPAYPEIDVTLPGTVATTANSPNVVATGANLSSYIAAGDLVRIYSPIFPTNYMVSIAQSVTNSSQLVLSTPVTNTGVIDTGLRIQRIKLPNQAFNYGLNDNVVRYYSETLVEYDTYDSVQFKFVFVSNNETVIPRMADFQAIGVSA